MAYRGGNDSCLIPLIQHTSPIFYLSASGSTLGAEAFGGGLDVADPLDGQCGDQIVVLAETNIELEPAEVKEQLVRLGAVQTRFGRPAARKGPHLPSAVFMSVRI